MKIKVKKKKQIKNQSLPKGFLLVGSQKWVAMPSIRLAKLLWTATDFFWPCQISKILPKKWVADFTCRTLIWKANIVEVTWRILHGWLYMMGEGNKLKDKYWRNNMEDSSCRTIIWKANIVEIKWRILHEWFHKMAHNLNGKYRRDNMKDSSWMTSHWSGHNLKCKYWRNNNEDSSWKEIVRKVNIEEITKRTPQRGS